MIELRGVVHRYGARTVLDLPNLGIARGDVLGVLGRNGSGKSTLLRLLGLLERPVEGQVLYHGRSLEDERSRLGQRRRMAMVFQDPLLFAGSVRSNVAYGLKVRGLRGGEVLSRSNRMLGMLGIEHLADRDTATLSGGEAQRVSLARALVTEPEVLFLDEPTTNLDVPARHSFRRDLVRLLRELTLTTVCVTHDPAEAIAVSNRLVVLSAGRIVQDAEPLQVWNRPTTAEVARLVGLEAPIPATFLGMEAGLARVKADGQSLLVRPPAFSISPGTPVQLCIRPEHVRIAADGPDGTAAVFSGPVEHVEPQANGVRLTIRCGGMLAAWVDAPSARSLDPRVGDLVHARVDPDDVHVIPDEVSTAQ
jgi:tungstate transport system ATP-binding protein